MAEKIDSSGEGPTVLAGGVSSKSSVLPGKAIDPKDCIITRKRKKYRFALFARSPLCFELDEWRNSRLPCLFRVRPGANSGTTEKVLQDGPGASWGQAEPVKITVEVGAGTGLFSVELAERHPDQLFIAVDVKGDRLQKGAREAEARGFTNIFFVRARADQLSEIVEEHSVTAIWLTFPDPFPKKRSANRRLTSDTYLSTYTNMLKRKGSLCLKHDNIDFFTWSLEQLVSAGWLLHELSFDLHSSNLPESYKIKTSYEPRWLEEGRITKFVKATKGE